MSKKNRRKTNNKINEPLPRADFETSDSRMYLFAALVIFHVIPLIFVILKFTLNPNFMWLYTQFAVQFNSILTAAITFIYGIKKGFNLKMPLVVTVIAVLSLLFYGEFLMNQTLHVLFAFGLVYALFAFGAVLLGAFLKKTFHMD